MKLRSMVALLAASGFVVGTPAVAATAFSNGSFDGYAGTPTTDTAAFETKASFVTPGTGVKPDSFASQPWAEDYTNLYKWDTSERLVASAFGNSTAGMSAAQSGGYFALLDGNAAKAIDSGFQSSLTQTFVAGATGDFRVSFYAWGDGRVALWSSEGGTQQSRLSLRESSDVSNTGVAYARPVSGHAYVVDGSYTASGNNTSNWRPYSFDVNLTVNKEYILYAVAGWTTLGSESGGTTLSANGLSPTNDSNVFAVDSFNVAEVPEPETYAMMLAGLAALGFAARRKAKTAVSP